MERGSADAAQDAYLRGVESLRLAAHHVQAAARERPNSRPNSVRLRDVHDRLSTDAISSWGGEIEGATGLTCQWHDQGWGNRKGMVFARTTGATPYYGTWQPLSGNEAPHAITRLGVQLPFSLRGRRVQFGYRVGGGGGHEIHIEQAVVNVQGGTAPAPARPTGNAAARERPSYNAAFAFNQRVEVRCRGGNQWFTGKITATPPFGRNRLYDILYDDGESEARVAESRIRRWVSTPHTGAPASARPSADAARDEAARREAARAREAAAERARAATLEHMRAAFHVGQRVEARTSTRSNQWFPAKITAVNGGRLYDILYDDGGISRGKSESLIRRYTGSGPAAPPPRSACRVCGGNFPHPACSGCGTPGARAAATTAQPGHSSPPSHAFPDARSFAGCFCTIFPCIPFAPLACENIIPHDSNSYQSKGVVILMFGYIPIPFCWDDHLARKHGNTFEVTTGCCQGTTDTWTSADGFHTSSSCCPAFRCG
ncbi:unnamed protein product [Pelagomonas calceolata]|uniref:Tudor domain-containing protein n=1 Tax=Pelagomonas calceolata TaxID=35677 RepID=A0A8J2SNB9_9STRA|nr:unnamed protein product [Pelagomonas calceolata]